MREICMKDDASILEIPSGENHVFGVVLPTSNSLTKDGLIDCRHKDTNYAARNLGVDRVAAEYYRKYGARVFYLGTFKNPSKGCMRLFSFPVRDKLKDSVDATTIAKSCEQLVSTLQKFKVDCCILPYFGDSLEMASFANCVCPILDVMFDDTFVMIYRRS